MTLRVLVSQPGSTPNCVTVGPWLTDTTRAFTPKEPRVSTMSWARASLSRGRTSISAASASRSSGGSAQPWPAGRPMGSARWKAGGLSSGSPVTRMGSRSSSSSADASSGASTVSSSGSGGAGGSSHSSSPPGTEGASARPPHAPSREGDAGRAPVRMEEGGRAKGEQELKVQPAPYPPEAVAPLLAAQGKAGGCGDYQHHHGPGQ